MAATRHRAVFVWVVAVGILTACGGTEAKQLSPAAYRDQAGRICAAAKSEVASLPRPGNSKELVASVQKLRDIGDKLITEILALKAPSQFESVVAEVNRLQIQERDIIDRFAAQVKQGINPRDALAEFKRRSPNLSERRPTLAAARHSSLRCPVDRHPRSNSGDDRPAS